MAESRKRQTSVFILLILAAGTVYKVPYLKSVFYDQLVASLDITIHSLEFFLPSMQA